MTSPRMLKLLDELDENLALATSLVGRGRERYRADIALPLAFEALCNRIGELAKRLMNEDAKRFTSIEWRLAAQNRDFVVHQYWQVDSEILWDTVAVSFVRLGAQADAVRATF